MELCELVQYNYSGSSYINESKVTEAIPDTFVNEKAPRTAMGVASNGSLYLIEVRALCLFK